MVQQKGLEKRIEKAHTENNNSKRRKPKKQKTRNKKNTFCIKLIYFFRILIL